MSLAATAALASALAIPAHAAPAPPSCGPAVMDYTCDGYPDLIAQDSRGNLWLYPGDGDGGFKPRIKSGTGWHFTLIIPFSTPFGEGVFARDSAGTLWSYPSNDHGGWLTPTRVGNGWNQMSSITNEAGDSALLAIDRSGTLWRYPYWFQNNVAGAPLNWLPRQRIGHGWAGYMLVESRGNQGSDFLARDTHGTLWPYFYFDEQRRDLRRAVFSFGAGWNRYTRIAMAGDFENYGNIEFVATDTHGDLWLYQSGFSPRVKIGHGWTGYTIY